jgi:hypothetical protein
MTNSGKRLGARVSAELRDAGSGIVSRGTALLFRDDDKSAHFYSHDSAPRDRIQSHARTLVLTDDNESRSIVAIEECVEEVPHELHFHLRLS